MKSVILLSLRESSMIFLSIFGQNHRILNIIAILELVDLFIEIDEIRSVLLEIV